MTATLISPPFFYGTAWKEDITEQCVLDALKTGFRAIDTANQRKHYFEEGVGNAISKAFDIFGIKRNDVFIQTKFTFSRGQDHRKPYDENAPLNTQVQQSFQSSLKNLNTDYLDSYILHGPATTIGLNDSDWETWIEMEKLCRQGLVKHLGVSNVNLEQLKELYEKSSIKPTFVQNRCFAVNQWEKNVRHFCKQSRIQFQGFSLLTANSKFLGGTTEKIEGRNVPKLAFKESEQLNLHPKINQILLRTEKNIQQIVFRFAQQVGIIPLVGARSIENMKMNLTMDFTLSETELNLLENIATL